MRHPAAAMNAARDVGGGRFVLSFPFLALTLFSSFGTFSSAVTTQPPSTLSWDLRESPSQADV